jgi:hypothetical protein
MNQANIRRAFNHLVNHGVKADDAPSSAEQHLTQAVFLLMQEIDGYAIYENMIDDDARKYLDYVVACNQVHVCGKLA